MGTFWLWMTTYMVPAMLFATEDIAGVIWGLMWFICVVAIAIMESNRRFNKRWAEIKP